MTKRKKTDNKMTKRKTTENKMTKRNLLILRNQNQYITTVRVNINNNSLCCYYFIIVFITYFVAICSLCVDCLFENSSPRKTNIKTSNILNFCLCYPLCLHIARLVNSNIIPIDDVFSLNNSTLGNYVNRIYHIEREIKDTTETSTLTYM
jgi:hypothetical protein